MLLINTRPSDRAAGLTEQLQTAQVSVLEGNSSGHVDEQARYLGNTLVLGQSALLHPCNTRELLLSLAVEHWDC